MTYTSELTLTFAHHLASSYLGICSAVYDKLYESNDAPSFAGYIFFTYLLFLLLELVMTLVLNLDATICAGPIHSYLQKNTFQFHQAMLIETVGNPQRFICSLSQCDRRIGVWYY